MRLGEVGWILFLAGLPFAAFLNKQLDLWHAQSLWSHVWIVVLVGLAYATRPRSRVPNYPLVAWVLWVGLDTLYGWTQVILIHKSYAFQMLMPLCHAVALLLFYEAAQTWWTAATLERLLVWVARAGVVVLAYGWLQVANLDQFFKYIDGSILRDQVVGTIGNPSHFGAYLSLLLPIFLHQDTIWWRWIALATVALIAITHSVSAWVATLILLLWWAMRQPWTVRAAVGLLSVGSVTVALLNLSLLNPMGRVEVWSHFWKMFAQRPITGYGLGFVMQYSQEITSGFLHKWRHVHNEFLQVLVEQGVIGAVILGWAVWSVAKLARQLPPSKTKHILVGTGMGFLLNCFVSFPAHLWLLGSFGLLSYCGLYALAQEPTESYS